MQDDEGNTLKSQDNRTGLRALPLKSMECGKGRSGNTGGFCRDKLDDVRVERHDRRPLMG